MLSQGLAVQAQAGLFIVGPLAAACRGTCQLCDLRIWGKPIQIDPTKTGSVHLVTYSSSSSSSSSSSEGQVGLQNMPSFSSSALVCNSLPL